MAQASDAFAPVSKLEASDTEKVPAKIHSAED